LNALRIRVLHGPNLNLLGTREPGLYGHQTLAQIDAHLAQLAHTLGAQLVADQTNHEGVLVDWIQASRHDFQGILINAAGLTHSSVCVRDALLAVGLPFVEVHLSNVFAREPFRHHSLLSDKALAVVTGFGPASYELALRGILAHLRAAEPPRG